MALIKCNECNNEISDTARECPNCGAKTIKAKETQMTIISIVIVVLLLIGFSVYQANEKAKELQSIEDSFHQSSERIHKALDN